MNTNLWLLIAIAAAVLIAGIVVLSRKSAKSLKPGKASGADQEKKEKRDGNNVKNAEKIPKQLIV